MRQGRGDAKSWGLLAQLFRCVTPARPLSLSGAEFPFLQNRETNPSLPGEKGREVFRD